MSRRRQSKKARFASRAREWRASWALIRDHARGSFDAYRLPKGGYVLMVHSDVAVDLIGELPHEHA